MNTRRRNFLVGLVALALCGSAIAHGPQARIGYPDGNVIASAVVWGNSRGLAGWTGSLNLISVHGYVPRYAVQMAPFRSGHRHGPACHHGSRYHASGHHGPRHAGERYAWKRHAHGHAQDRGHGNDRRDRH
jgi:hypothetical protein